MQKGTIRVVQATFHEVMDTCSTHHCQNIEKLKFSVSVPKSAVPPDLLYLLLGVP